MAYVLFSLADVAIYFGFLVILKSVYKNHRLFCLAFLIFISPFVYPLANSGSLFNVLWMLFFTPLYGVIVMMIAYTNWMILYYVVAYGSFAALNFFCKKKPRSHG
jgi:hypothetical protein